MKFKDKHIIALCSIATFVKGQWYCNMEIQQKLNSYLHTSNGIQQGKVHNSLYLLHQTHYCKFAKGKVSLCH